MSSPEQQTAASAESAPRSQDGDEPTLLFSQGTDGPHVDAYRARVAGLLTKFVLPLLEAAEADRRFPRQAAEAVASAGLFRDRWRGPHGDTGRALVFSEELGRAALGGIGVGLIVQSESVVPVLRRFGRSPEADRWKEAVLDGKAIGSVAASEPQGGSDLSAVQTLQAVREMAGGSEAGNGSRDPRARPTSSSCSAGSTRNLGCSGRRSGSPWSRNGTLRSAISRPRAAGALRPAGWRSTVRFQTHYYWSRKAWGCTPSTGV